MLRLARQLGDEDAGARCRPPRDRRARRCGRCLQHGGDVHAPLVGEGAVADVGLATDTAACWRARRRIARRRASSRSCSSVTQSRPIFSLRFGMTTDEVGVAAALAEAVDGALHLRDAGLDRRERVGHGAAPRRCGSGCRAGARTPGALTARSSRRARGGSVPPLVSQRTRQSAPASAAACSVGERVVAVGSEAVEEVLGVEDDLVRPRLEEGDGVADHRQVLFQRRLQHLGHVEVPRLADDASRRALPASRRARRLGSYSATPPARRVLPNAASLACLSVTSCMRREELSVLGVGAGPAALDVVDAEARPAGRSGEPCPRPRRTCPHLGAVAQRRVVNPDQTAHFRLLRPSRIGPAMMRRRRRGCQGCDGDGIGPLPGV